MNRSELETKVWQRMGGPKAMAGGYVDAVLGLITEAVAAGEEVKLIGFGTFHVGDRAATTGRNPRTGEAIEVPAQRTVKFRAGRELKRAAANGAEERAA